MTLLDLVLIALATARITRLVTEDKITEWPREKLLMRWLGRDSESLAAYLILCSWCVSFWAGALVAAGWWLTDATMWYMVTMAALSASHVTGVIASSARTGD
jgi:hypothetical protein